jgi:hypothetical protein
MFILNETSIGASLKDINLITLTFYSSKSELLNIYDTNFKFDENIIPLITSVLELEPHIIHAKKYMNVDSESVIIVDTNIRNHNKSNLSFPSFFHDMKDMENIQYIQSYKKKLVNTLDSFSNTDTMLIRIYNITATQGYFGKAILNEEDLLIIIWNLEFANFQIIINKQKPNYCKLQLTIYATEENTFISYKLDIINKTIEKINKIKNEIVSRTL